MFHKEKNQKLECEIYFKPMQKVLKISLEKDCSFSLKRKINTLFNSEYKSRLMYLFTYKIKDIQIQEKVTDFINDNFMLDDKKIFDGILDIVKDKNYSDARGIYRISSITKYIKSWDKISPTFYLDIGSFKGDITEAVGKHFNLNKFQIHGIDIKEYTHNDNFIFTKYDGITIPYNHESFDLVTCFMVLHHVPKENLNSLLKEIFRVMKPGGVLIIREHDAKGKDFMLLDTLHEYYDYVLDPLCTWNESHANYFSLKQISKKLMDVGFTRSCIPTLNKNNPKNPFNNYVATFKKPKVPIIQRELFRKLTSDFCREKYERRVHDKRNYIHWGQRKLLISEIEFLCVFFKNQTTTSQSDVVVVYAGAAPGTHILILRELFPQIKFILYDPARFNSDLLTDEKIEIHNELFTDEVCITLRDKYAKHVLLFVSDIRTANIATMDAEQVESHIDADQQMQMRWYNLLKPELSMLKFRLPWENKIITYLKGEIYIQAYAPLSSTETRLIVEKDALLTEYDSKAYEEQMFYFNKYLRDSHYLNANNPNEFLNYDEAIEQYIINLYFKLNDEQNFSNCLENFNTDPSSYISSKLSKTRTLKSAQPLSLSKKELVKTLVKKKLVPSDINYTIEDYNLYVLPICDKIENIN